MSDFGDAVGGVVGLAFAGVLLLLFASALDRSAPIIDFSFWGVVYIIVAVILGIAVVVLAVRSIFE